MTPGPSLRKNPSKATTSSKLRSRHALTELRLAIPDGVLAVAWVQLLHVLGEVPERVVQGRPFVISLLAMVERTPEVFDGFDEVSIPFDHGDADWAVEGAVKHPECPQAAPKGEPRPISDCDLGFVAVSVALPFGKEVPQGFQVLSA